MKKYFLFIPFILLFSILFLMGCSNKNENKNNDISKDTTCTTNSATSDDGAVGNTSVVQTSEVEDEDTVKLDIFYNLFNPKNNQLLNSFDKKPNDMGNVSETIRCDYNTYVDLFSSPNEGYTFVGWYNEGQVLSNEKNYKYMMWDKDFTIEARFKYTLYNLKVWSNNSDLGQVMIRDGYSQAFYNEETLEEYYTEQVTIVAYSKTDTRRFLGWYDENNKLVSTNAVYTFNMVNRDYTLEAKWDYFNITYDLDGGINDVSNPSYYTVDTQNIVLKSPTKEGYTFQGWEYEGNKITEINISNLCHIKLRALWTYYTLTTRANNDKAGTISAYNNTKITEGKSITITATTNPGYTFNGWFNGDKELTTNSSYTFNMPAENLVYIARWTVNTNTPYKVEHYLQNIDNDNYPSTPYEVDNLFGTTDTFTDASVKTYDGFTSPLITQAIINGNGETVIRINYSRNLYNIYLNKNNNGGQVIGAGKYKYDKSITIEATIFDGYTFEGWYDGTRQITDKLLYSFKMPETNLNYTAKWTANTDTPYKVEHYFQNVDDDNYPIIPNEVDYLVGTTDTLTKAEAKSYIGFESPTITQINIDGSGETIVKLYYKRSSYNISFSPEIYAKDGFSNINETFKPNEYFSINKSTFSGLFSDDVGINGVDYLGNSKVYTYANDTYVNCSVSSYIKITVPTDNSRLYVAFVSTQSSVSRGMFVGTTISANFNDEIAGSYTNGLEMTYIDVKLDKGVYYLNYTGKVRIFEMYLIENKCIYGSISGEGLYKYGKSVTIKATTNPGYTFTGWYDGDNQISPLETYTFNMPAENLSYTAKWTANTNTTYKVEHYLQNLDDNNYPTTPFETDNLTGTTDTLTNGEVNTYEGFTSPTIIQVNINGDGSTVIKLNYTRNSYTVSLSQNNDKAGTITGAGIYKYGKSITITATTNPGYTFNGWYLNDSPYKEEESFIYTVGTSLVEFDARYKINKYIITLDNQATGINIAGIISGEEYEFDTQITLTAENISEGKYLVWYSNDIAFALGDSYTFNIPSRNVTIKTKLVDALESIAYTRNESKIYFGTYPQTKVEATTENGLSSITYDSTWISYKYYISSVQTDFMYYKDVDIDNNGTYDYRGVYFTRYRPAEYLYGSSNDDSNQDDNGYSTNTIYWFSYDPIEWNILTESNGKALILANLLLDSQDYYPSSSPSSFTHNGGAGYANNYELSAIRKFLNNDFYNTAFNDLQKAIIETTTVDNSASSTASITNSYACNNTEDKLFLLSYSEVTNSTYGLDSKTARKAKGSDYAKCQGLCVPTYSGDLVYSYWWLRSPYYSYGYGASAYVVKNDGSIDDCNVRNNSLGGVRPACWISLLKIS